MIGQITAAGGDIRFAWLPQLVKNSLYQGSPGPIRGNEHMVMLDKNNQDIAQDSHRLGELAWSIINDSKVLTYASLPAHAGRLKFAHQSMTSVC